MRRKIYKIITTNGLFKTFNRKWQSGCSMNMKKNILELDQMFLNEVQKVRRKVKKINRKVSPG